MTIDERIEILEMECHWSMMDKEHLEAVKSELTRLRSEVAEKEAFLKVAEETLGADIKALIRSLGDSYVEIERLLKENVELTAIIKVLERENKELSQYNKPAETSSWQSSKTKGKGE